MGFLALIPFVMSTVQHIESIFGPKTGTQKKDAAVAAVSDVLNIFNTIQPGGKTVNSSQMMEGIGEVIDGVVKVMNATGQFTH